MKTYKIIFEDVIVDGIYEGNVVCDVPLTTNGISDINIDVLEKMMKQDIRNRRKKNLKRALA